MRKKLLSSVIALALLIGLFALLNLTALAAPATPYEALNVNFFNGTANICIEGNSGTSSAGGTIDLWTWWANSWYYVWRMVPDANHEYFQFRRQTSATATATTALAPTGGVVAAGTRLTLAAGSTTADNQWWKLERQDNGRYLIINKADPTLCMAPISAASGQGIQLSTKPATLAASDTWRILVHSTTATAASQLVSADQPIQSVASLAAIEVPMGTAVSALGLPSRVNVTYAGGTEGALAVTWDTAAYNGNAEGTYNLIGTLVLSGLATQPTPAVTATVAVKVGEGGGLINAEYPTITTQPAGKTVEIGETATLTVAATVTKGTLSYQWYSGNAPGVLISGATGASYNAPTTAAGTTNYFCMVTNTDDEATGSKTATVTSSVASVTVNPAVVAGGPVIKEAKLVTSTFIELDWEGQQYINNAGRSKERTTFSATNNFEVLLNGTNLAQSYPWYWNNMNMLLHSVRVNQNKTTLRLSTALTTAQMNAIGNGTSTLTVRITNTSSNVTGSDLLNYPNGTPAGNPCAIPEANIGPPGPPADTTKVYNVIYKPYYDKQVTAITGLTIKGSEFVNLRTVQKAADITDVIMSAMPQAVVNTISSQGAFLLFGPGEHSYNIPEQRSIFLQSPPDNYWSRAEGYGGSNAATSAANVERCNVVVSGVTNNPADYYPAGYRSGYQNESILAHEFGHKIQTGFNSVYASTHPLRQEFTSAFSQVTSRVMWTPYVRDASGGSEYFATLTAVWYNGMSEGNGANCNTRDELFRYDRRGYDFFSKLYSVDKVILSPDWANCPNTAAPTWATGNADPNTTRQTRAISATPALPAVTVPVGTPLSAITLPDKVQVAFTDSFSSAPLSWTAPYGLDLYPVNWDTSAYNGNLPGTYILEGTPHASYPGRYLTTGPYLTDVITNPSNIKATIEVTVEMPLVIEVANVIAKPGSTVDVTYKISGNLLGYANLDLSIPYLSGVYTPKTVTPGPALDPTFFIVNPAAKPDLMRIVFISLENIVGDGLLFTVTYQVDAAAPNTGEYSLGLEVVKLQYGLDKDTMVDLTAAVEPGTLLLGMMGDINGDGQITPEDAMILLQMYVGLIPWTPHALLFGDVNGDGVIDTTDAAIILRMVVGA